MNQEMVIEHFECACCKRLIEPVFAIVVVDAELLVQVSCPWCRAVIYYGALTVVDN